MKINSSQKKYHSQNHLTYSCQYHVIFCPKYRRKILVNGIDTRLKELLFEIARKYRFKIIEIEVMPDHVHLLIDCNPRFGIINCVWKLKGISSTMLRKEFHILKQTMPTLWARGIFISSVESVSLDIVKKYIENQK